MTIYLKQSTASQEVALGFFVDSTDGNTEKTGLTIANTDIRLHKAGATTLANPAAGATHISNGIYYWVADATDTNTLGSMAVYCHPTGALATKVECVVLAANVYDSLIGGGDILDVSVTQLLGTAWLTPGTAGTPDVNVVKVGGTTQTAGDIMADTNDIQARLPAALVSGRMDCSVGAMAANVMTAAAAAADLTTELQSGLATAANLAIVAGYIDTEIGDIQSRLPAALVGGRMDASVGAVAANAITAAGIADGAIDRATFAADTGMVAIRSNTAQAGASTSITLDTSASAVTDFYKNDMIVLTGGTGAGQGRYCTAYNGTTKVATVSAWATNPDATSTFAIIAADAIVGATAPTAAQVADEVQTRTIAAVTVVNGLAANVITAAATAADFTTEIQAGLATSSALATVASYIDTEVAAIKAVTDALPNAGALTTIQSDLDNIQTRIPAALVGGRMDADMGAIGTSTTALAAFKRAVQGNVIGTVGAASTTTSIVTSAVTPATSVADQLKGRILTFADDTTTAALRGQATDITASSASATPVLTVTALTTAPASSDTFTVT